MPDTRTVFQESVKALLTFLHSDKFKNLPSNKYEHLDNIIFSFYKDYPHEDLTEDFLKIIDIFLDSEYSRTRSKNNKVITKFLDFKKVNGFYVDIYNKAIKYDGNRSLKPCYTELPLTLGHKIELYKCSKSFYYFRNNYCKIKTKRGIRLPEAREYQKSLEDDLINYTHIVALWSRQSGKSVTVGNFALHQILFKSNYNVGVAANQAKAAREYLDKVKKVYLNLPIWLQQGVEVWNKSEIELENGSKFMTSATNSDSFRGETCLGPDEKITLRDKKTKEIKEISISEAYNTTVSTKFEILTPTGFKNFSHIRKVQGIGLKIYFADDTDIVCTKDHRFIYKNTELIASNLKVGDFIGKKIIKIEDSQEINFYDPVEVEGHQYMSSDIIHHNCNFIIVDECAFIPKSLYDEFADAVFPSQEALDDTRTVLTSTANGINHWYFICKAAENKENPQLPGKSGYKFNTMSWREIPGKDEEWKENVIKKYGEIYFNQNFNNQFIGSSHTLISTSVLTTLTHEESINKFIPDLRVYEEPKKGHNYILSVDAAKDGIDSFAIQLIDVTKLPFIQVAAADLQVNYLKMPEQIYTLGTSYNNAFIIIENNEGAGQSIADTLRQTFEYENMYRDRSTSDDRKFKRYFGFRNTSKTRTQILTLLKIFIENDKLIIKDKRSIEELQNFIEKNNKYQAEDGFHDDLVLALAIAFAPLMSVRGFENQVAFINQMFSNIEEEQKEFEEMFSFGAFEDGTDDLEGMDDFHKKLILGDSYHEDIEEDFYKYT